LEQLLQLALVVVPDVEKEHHKSFKISIIGK
jgi:hypothetical protein